MITTKQKVALGALVPLCAAVWGPQLYERFQGSSTSAQVPLEGPTEAEMAMMEEDDFDAGFSGVPSGPGAGSNRPSPSGSERSTEGPSSVVDEVIRALRGADAFRAGPGLTSAPTVKPLEEPEPAQAEPVVETIIEIPAPEESALDLFLESNPLRGTLTGASTRYALMGSHRLIEGDQLPGTEAILVSIRRGQVTVEEAGEPRVVDLPPLRTDPSRVQQPGTGTDEGADAEAATELQIPTLTPSQAEGQGGL